MGKSTKILMLVENVAGPSDTRVWAEARVLRDQGFQVSIIGPKSTKKYPESYICLEGIHVYQYPMPTNANKSLAYIAEYCVALLLTFWLSLKVLLRHGFDVIHAANPPDLFFLIGLFYRLLGKKFVFDQHDLAPEVFQVKFQGRMRSLHKLLCFLEWCSYRTAHLVITPNVSVKHFAIERGHFDASRVFVVRNVPELKRIKLVPPEPELKRGRRYLLAFVGMMEAQDGVENILYALHNLIYQRGRQDVGLVMMGEGSQEPLLRALAHELALDEFVEFTGFVEAQDIVRYLSVADVGLTPEPANGLNEYNTTVKTMEYMALGKPVVAFDLAETHLIAQDSALYARPNLVEDFADKIVTLLDDEPLRVKMGAIGRQRIVEEFNWDQNRSKLLQAYERLFIGSSNRVSVILNKST